MNTNALLVVCHGYPPYYGGAEHVAAYLAHEACGDAEVSVLTSDIGGRLPPEEGRDGARIVRVPARKREWTRHTARELLSFHLSAVRRLPDVFRETRPRMTIAHFAYPAGAVALALRRRFGTPYAVVLHGSDVPGYQNRRFGAIYPAYRHLFRRVCNGAEHVIAVSDELAELCRKSWGGRIRVIRNGVDIQRFTPAPPSPGNPESLRIVMTAQLIERKGIDTLLDAFAGMPVDERKTFVVTIFGEGPYRGHIERRIAAEKLDRCVRIEGWIAAEAVPDALRMAKAYVLTSFQEGLPLALLEAMGSGLPVIATHVGGIPSVVKDGVNGLLHDPGDAAALACAMRRLRDDPGLRTRLGQEARRTAETMSWSSVWRQYRALLFPTKAG